MSEGNIDDCIRDPAVVSIPLRWEVPRSSRRNEILCLDLVVIHLSSDSDWTVKSIRVQNRRNQDMNIDCAVDVIETEKVILPV